MQRIGKVYGHLTAFLSSLSLVVLIKLGFGIGLITPISRALEWFQEAVGFALGWMEPWIHALISQLNLWTGWHLHLYPQWRYVFILIWVYFMSFTKVWAAGWEEEGSWDEELAAVPRWMWYTLSSLAMSLAISIGSGLSPMNAVSTDWRSDLFLVGIVGLGILVFWELWSWRLPWVGWIISSEQYRGNRNAKIPRLRVALFAVGMPALIVGVSEVFLGEYIRLLSSPSLAFLLIFILLLALNWFVLGALYLILPTLAGTFVGPHRWWRDFMHNGLTRTGVLMMFSILEAGVIEGVNAVMKSAGL